LTVKLSKIEKEVEELSKVEPIKKNPEQKSAVKLESHIAKGMLKSKDEIYTYLSNIKK
jgi:hypothetical protein